MVIMIGTLQPLTIAMRYFRFGVQEAQGSLVLVTDLSLCYGILFSSSASLIHQIQVLFQSG